MIILVYLGGARSIGALMPEGQSQASPTVAVEYSITLAGRAADPHRPHPCKSISLRVARIHALFVYARLLSQSRGSIP
jgi:hypothetical protein